MRVILLSLMTCATPCMAMPDFLKGSLFEAVGIEVGVDPLLLYSVTIVESGASTDGKNISPTPLVIRSAQGAEFFSTLEEASNRLREVAKTEKSVDVGICQRNLKWHPHETPEIFLDAKTCLSWAAEQIKFTLSSTPDLALGVGRYHIWTDEVRAVSYGKRVLHVYHNLKNYTP